jgi:tRNA uridine 5-carbamoylmethylation protein Kti12
VTGTLVIMRGLPSSGKTTFARSWVAENHNVRTRVNRDDLRAMMNEGAPHSPEAERRIINARDALITSLLRRNLDVICDDTNLPPRTLHQLRDLTVKTGTVAEIIDLTHVSLAVCLARNAARTDKSPVPEEWIRSMHERYIMQRVITSAEM